MSATPPTRDLIRSLHEARTGFGTTPSARKLELLAQCSERRLTDARLVRDYHRVLLYLAAHPDSPRQQRLVGDELRRVADAAESLARSRTSADILRDTGISGTDVVFACTFELASWLADRFPDDADVAWDGESAGPALDDLLPLCTSKAEGDGLLDSSLTTARWFEIARGPDEKSDLRWLLDRLRRLDCPPDLLDRLFDGVDLQIRIRLREPGSSLTFARFPPRKAYYHREPLRRAVDPRSIVKRPLPPARQPGSAEARRLLETARMALVVRHRETDPVTYANPREIAVFSLERGIDVATFGMLAEQRLPIESFFGYVVARNRVPVGYGGAWVLFDRAEIGVNVFDAFRGGESALLFSQIMRVYAQHFGARRFVVDPFQFGAGNTEGIRTGAFWFYYRLGFRPVDPDLAALADEHWRRLRTEPRGRTPPSVLRRLATTKVHWAPGRAGESPDLVRLSLAATRMIGERHGGDRERAERACRRDVARWLGVRDAERWPAEQRRWFGRLCPLIALIPEVREWPARDRRSLVAIMRAKGGLRERDYAERLRGHERLREAWNRVTSAASNGG